MAIPNSKDAKGKTATDPKQEAKNKQLKLKRIAAAKMALRIAAIKTKTGAMRWVGFAFSPGPNKKEHILMLDVRKKGTALMKDIRTLAPTRKEFCFGVATVTKQGKPTLWIKYIKRLGGAERKMQEALIDMRLAYQVKLRKKKDDDAESQQADESRKEDEPEDDLGASAEDFDDEGSAEDLENAVGQDDDLDDLENAHEEDETEDGDDDIPLNMRRRDTGDDDAEEEGEDEEEGEEEGDATAAAAAAAQHAALGKAPEVWLGTHRVMASSIDKLKAAIKAEYANESPDLIAEIEKNMSKLDRILEKLDHRLAESLEKAHKAKDEAARKAELSKAKTLLKEHIVYVSSEPLIAHIDANPFVATNIKALLTKSLQHMATVVK